VTDAFSRLRDKPAKLVIGLISGTSADGVTGALVKITERDRDTPGTTLLGWATVPYPPDVQRRLHDIFVEPSTLQHVAGLNVVLGELFAGAAAAAASAGGVGLGAVDLIASHGQTVAHVGRRDPADPLSRAATLQLGEAAVIAERTGLPVIADFRAADMAAGGVGAPFVPYADLLLLGGPTGRIALNLGGISNITVLPAGATSQDVFAFDCGPANMVIDGLVRHFSGGEESYDRDGARAARGRANGGLLREMLAHPFIIAPPPKAAGHEQFGRAFLRDVLQAWGELPPDDLVATATAFAADAVAANITRFVLPHHAIEDVVASGGGVRNPVLMRRLADAAAPLRLRLIDEFGIPSEAKEALAFALIGHATLMGRPANLPRVTGAHHGALLGKLAYPPPPHDRDAGGPAGAGV
jgi:anhydro-N-acetylmuramic acid kinase